MKGIRGLCQKTVLIDIGLIGTLLYLIYLLLVNDRLLKGLSSSSSLDIEEVDSINNNNIDTAKSSLEFQIKLQTLKDVRSAECRDLLYPETDEKVTLVTYFYDYQLYDLKTSLTTALEKEDLIGELLVFDDGSTERKLTEEAKVYFKQLKIPVRLFHNDVRKGTAKILKKAISEAKNDAVVFMDTTVICNKGWLAPLLHQITKVPSSIAVPHFDKVTNLFPLQYKPIEDTYIATLRWNLHVVLKRTRVNNANTSPSLRPDLFAFKKSFLESMGGVDDNFQLGGGDSAELGIRVWTCGGSIKIANCSRVGLMNFDTPFKITSGFNSRHIVGMWFQGKYSNLYSNIQPSGEHLRVIAQRKGSVLEPKRCKSIQWYFDTVLGKNIQIDDKTVKVGFLKAESGSCIGVGDDMKIDVINCDFIDNIEINPAHVFQLTGDKKLISGEKCLTATSTAYVVVEDCRAHDRQQSWEFNMNMKIINLATKACATHVTDPSSFTPNRQIMMVQDCLSEKEDHEKFKKWTFLPI